MKMHISGAVAAVLLMAAPPAFAMTEAECVKAFESADVNKDGSLSDGEAARYVAMSQNGTKAGPETNITKDAFITNCKAGAYTMAANSTDASAPVAGANSFTEGQAKDRITAAGFTDVSALAKDDKGVWRGTAKQSGKQVNVAVDYRGNVVAN